jgi:hypothetical protein
MLLLRLLCDALALLVLLGGVGDGKTYASGQLAVAILMIMLRGVGGRFAHTRGKRLLELLGLVLILEDEGVEVTVAADLELDLLGGGLLDTGSCCPKISLGVHFCVCRAPEGKTHRKRPCGGRSR